MSHLRGKVPEGERAKVKEGRVVGLGLFLESVVGLGARREVSV